MILYCTVSHNSQILLKKCNIYIPHLCSMPLLGVITSKFRKDVWYWKNQNDVATTCSRKYDDMLSRFDTILEHDRRMDRIPIPY